jgi:probable biosynthetic protein (TIGR04098 family)
VLIETTELTLSNVGLGTLTEYSLLTLFATAQAHRLTRDVGHSLAEVTDANGAALYPGYVWLHLRVPPSRRLDAFRVWDRVAVGVDVQRYGRLILDSTYILGTPDEIAAAPQPWQLTAFPSMRANSLWVVAGTQDDLPPSSPKEGSISPLPALRANPDAIARFRAMRGVGRFTTEQSRRWRAPTPLSYPIVDGRDVARGQNLMFATYVQIMGWATTALLGEHIWPTLPYALNQCRSLIEREVFFFGHTGASQRVLADIRADITRCPVDAHGSDPDVTSAGVLEVECELYEAGSNRLLAVSRSKELFLVPRDRSTLVSDLERFLPPKESG